MPDSPAPASWHVPLPHTAAAVPMARAAIRAALAGSDDPAGRDTAELLTAELVANAVRHTPGGSRIELVVELLPKQCRVEVRDADPEPPAALSPHAPQPEPGPWQEHGRGLLLIRSLSSECGHLLTAWGKAVWFSLTVRN
ncbi:ATP-binding protein [Streptomyces zhihengii]|uniref:ATP-binding protein n=1 Tax=Streptomyces zhihengii TaxID=1818004 RepID=UPI0033A21B02